MLRKKAISTEILMYLLGIVVFVLLLIIGYKMIFQFKEKSDEIILIKFQKDLQATIDSVSFGTTKIREFEVPPGYREFWLIDRKNAAACAAQNAPPLVEATNLDMENNAFLIGPQKFEAFYIERVSIGSGCLSAAVTNNKITLGLRKG